MCREPKMEKFCKRCLQWREHEAFTNREAVCDMCFSIIKRERFRKSRYGLPKEDFLELAKAQKYRCAICGKLYGKGHIDHDHNTGKVRGILCVACNTALGLLKDDVALFESAITYLKVNE